MARPSQDPCILLLRDLVAIDSVNPTLVPRETPKRERREKSA